MNGEPGVYPFMSAAAVVITLNVDPGGSESCVAWLSSGLISSADSSSQLSVTVAGL